MNKTAKQLLKEFWAPFVAASVWTSYALFHAPASEPVLAVIVKAFGPVFFFVSWLLAQVFRIRKQAKVDSDLLSIDRQLKDTLRHLDEKTSDLAAHITGGDSFCYAEVSNLRLGEGVRLILHHEGLRALYDVQVRVFDCDNHSRDLEPYFDVFLSGQVHFQVPLLVAGTVLPTNCEFNVGETDSRSLNIFYSARNGHFTQLLRCKKVAGKWLYATLVERKDKTIFQSVDPHYPRNELGEIVW